LEKLEGLRINEEGKGPFKGTRLLGETLSWSAGESLYDGEGELLNLETKENENQGSTSIPSKKGRADSLFGRGLWEKTRTSHQKKKS